MIILGVLLIFIYNFAIEPLLKNAEEMGEPLNILEPFIAVANSDAILLIIPLVFLTLIADFPKIDTNTVFYIIRVGRINWLLGQMQDKGWVISSFCFDYESRGYIALVILYQPNEPKHEYGLLKIDFLREENMDQHLLVEANVKGLLGNAREIREFFGILIEQHYASAALFFLAHKVFAGSDRLAFPHRVMEQSVELIA